MQRKDSLTMIQVFGWQSEFTPALRLWVQTLRTLTFCLWRAGSAGSCRRSSVLAPPDGLQEDRSCLTQKRSSRGLLTSCAHARASSGAAVTPWHRRFLSSYSTLSTSAQRHFCFGQCTAVISVVQHTGTSTRTGSRRVTIYGNTKMQQYVLSVVHPK